MKNFIPEHESSQIFQPTILIVVNATKPEYLNRFNRLYTLSQCPERLKPFNISGNACLPRLKSWVEPTCFRLWQKFGMTHVSVRQSELEDGAQREALGFVDTWEYPSAAPVPYLIGNQFFVEMTWG